MTETKPGSLIIINQTNATDFIKLHKDRKKLYQTALWHKFIAHNVSSAPREQVLKAVLNFVQPFDLIPVNYITEGPNAIFLGRNCGAAIEKLCQDNLVVNWDGLTFTLTIIVGFSNTTDTQFKVQSNIVATLNKRFNAQTKILNLDSFNKDPALSEVIFCILSQPKILYFVLHLAKSLAPETLKLSNNELKVLTPIEVLVNEKNLTCLDLRNNLIDNMLSLKVLKVMKIKELWLDGNPVCNNYDERGYIEAVKEICPKIRKLDGVSVLEKGFLAFRRNYVISSDAVQLADQFLSHYFNLYDSNNRHCFIELYHENAIFSLSCSYITGQCTSSSVSLENYKKFSRNLLRMSDFSKVSENVVYGPNNIVAMLNNLPPSEHDPYTFTVDVIHYTKSTCILTVTGAFKESLDIKQDRLFGFSRTFVLAAQNTGEYLILNDMLHITNATNSLVNRAFKNVKIRKTNNIPPNDVCAIEPIEKKEMADALSKITTLNINWSRKCLEDSQWNFKKALEVFVDLYKLEKIPAEAFVAS